MPPRSSPPLGWRTLTPGSRVRGVLATPVTVVGVTWHGTNALTLVYRGDGGVGEAVLYRDHEAGLTVEAASSAYSFDADPELFRVAAEALRIRMAGRYDQMLAVQSSAVEPLPQQIKAVYGELLPRTPLRFLLADDPGAGKTIMAGLYIKELEPAWRPRPLPGRGARQPGRAVAGGSCWTSSASGSRC
jgi:hypothetical protein